LWLILAVLGFALATGCKWLFNDLEASFFDQYNGPEARTADDAAAQGLLVARFRIEPARLEGGGKVYEFDEAWLEAADVPGHRLVWLPDQRRADWCYLCVRPKTGWFQETFSFNPAPEYPAPFQVGGPGRGGLRWTQSGNDLYFQKVPTDLRELDIRVVADTYGAGKDLVVGTAHMTRAD
jgi:hypothetical protein